MVLVVAAVTVVLVVAVYERSLSKRTTVTQESILGADSADGGRRCSRGESSLVSSVMSQLSLGAYESIPAQVTTKTARARC